MKKTIKIVGPRNPKWFKQILCCNCCRYGGSLGGPGTTMTLGRKGHYASLRAARTADTDMPFLGPNQGQYATLSKGCKTLESSDFY